MKPERMSIDFAARRPQATRIGQVLLLAAAASLMWFAAQAFRVWNAQHQQTQALTELESRQQAEHVSQLRSEPMAPGDVARLRLVKSTAVNLQTPWSDLLAALESAPSESVALLSIEPSVQKRTVRLTAEARNSQAMLDYVAALQRDTRLNRVVLVSHQLQQDAPGTPVRFQLQANWGASP
jgi:Tfp pilus assembly protein PilN